MTGHCPAATGLKISARRTRPSSMVIGTSQSMRMSSRTSVSRRSSDRFIPRSSEGISAAGAALCQPSFTLIFSREGDEFVQGNSRGQPLQPFVLRHREAQGDRKYFRRARKRHEADTDLVRDDEITRTHVEAAYDDRLVDPDGLDSPLAGHGAHA